MDIKIEKTVVTAKPRQLKGTWTYAPYVPNVMVKPTVKSTLKSLHEKYVLWKASHESDSPIKEAQDVMQEKYPGPYVIVEAYNPQRGCFELQTKFADPKQETLWRIKYG